jgi:hypothetical protein
MALALDKLELASQNEANAAASFPLNRAGGLRGHVVNHAVDAAHFIDDAGGVAAE